MKKIYYFTIAMLLLSFASAIYFYPILPEKIASHWDINGDANGYMDKGTGIFFIPMLSVLIFGMFLVLQKIDPLAKNKEKISMTYAWTTCLTVVFLSYLHFLVILWNTGQQFDFGRYLLPSFAVLFYFIGAIIEKADRNWFIGIRTPWTLNSDSVWEKTHKFGGKLFRIAGIIAMLGIFAEGYYLWFMLIPAMVSGLITVVYSYAVYRKGINRENTKKT